MTSRSAPLPGPLPAARGEGTGFDLPLRPRNVDERAGVRASRLVALAVLLAAAGCGHRRSRRAAAANPIAPVVLPKTNAEAQAAFDEGVRLMKMGKKHYKEARKPLQRATELDGRLFEAWHDLGVIETSLGNFDKAVDDFERALDIQPGARKTLLAYGESLRRAHRPRRRRRCTRSGWTRTRTTSRCAPATGRSCARPGRSTSRWNRRACFLEPRVRTYPTR